MKVFNLWRVVSCVSSVDEDGLEAEPFCGSYVARHRVPCVEDVFSVHVVVVEDAFHVILGGLQVTGFEAEVGVVE